MGMYNFTNKEMLEKGRIAVEDSKSLCYTLGLIQEPVNIDFFYVQYNGFGLA